MTSVPDGATRYDRIQGRIRRSTVVETGLFVVAVGIAIVLPLLNGADPLLVAGIFVAAAAIAAATYLLPGRLRWPVVIVVAVAGAAIVVPLTEDGTSALVWFAAFFGCQIPVNAMTSRAQWSARLSTAVGAPASAAHPQRGDKVDHLALWTTTEHDFEAVDPAWETLRDALHRLDGRERTLLMLWRGPHRLAVGGDAAGRMIVIGTNDQGRWIALQSSAKPEDKTFRQTLEDGCDIPFATELVRTPLQHVVGIDLAEQALQHLHRTGSQDPDLTWWRDVTVLQHLRPKEVLLNDA